MEFIRIENGLERFASVNSDKFMNFMIIMFIYTVGLNWSLVLRLSDHTSGHLLLLGHHVWVLVDHARLSNHATRHTTRLHHSRLSNHSWLSRHHSRLSHHHRLRSHHWLSDHWLLDNGSCRSHLLLWSLSWFLWGFFGGLFLVLVELVVDTSSADEQAESSCDTPSTRGTTSAARVLFELHVVLDTDVPEVGVFPSVGVLSRLI